LSFIDLYDPTNFYPKIFIRIVHRFFFGFAQKTHEFYIGTQKMTSRSQLFSFLGAKF